MTRIILGDVLLLLLTGVYALCLINALLRKHDVWQMLFQSDSGCYSWKHVAFKATLRARPVTAPIFDVSLPVIKTICGSSHGFFSLVL